MLAYKRQLDLSGPNSAPFGVGCCHVPTFMGVVISLLGENCSLICAGVRSFLSR